MSIFISVASYRDAELVKTIHSIIDNADSGHELFFGIVDQDQEDRWTDLSFIKNLKHIKMNYKDARGAGYARKLATELYDGQDFFFQTDSHMRFAKGWDTKLIDMYKWCSEYEKTNKIILSQFPAPYEIIENNIEKFPVGDPDFWDEPSWTSVVNTYYGAWAGNREKINDFSHPHKSHTVLGAMIFSHGKIAYDIPYDERISFMGEELCYAIRAYTRGYKIYAPNEMIAWHFYKRTDRPKVWGDKAFEWYDIEKYSKDIQEDVLTCKEIGIYGIDDIGLYQQYQSMVGIDFNKFYQEKSEGKKDLDWVSEEIIFDINPTTVSGMCLNNEHGLCKMNVCVCNCHGEK